MKDSSQGKVKKSCIASDAALDVLCDASHHEGQGAQGGAGGDEAEERLQVIHHSALSLLAAHCSLLVAWCSWSVPFACFPLVQLWGERSAEWLWVCGGRR